MTFNPIAFKQCFPLFQQAEYQDLIYLDNAATTQTPQAVIQAISDFYTHSNGNAHRSSYQLAQKSTAIIEKVRQDIGQFIGAKAENIIFCRGATEGINLLAKTLNEFIQPGEEIILTSAEHHANLLPWLALAKAKNLLVRYLPDHQGRPDLAALPKMLNDKTALVSLTLASNVLGCRLPIESLATQLAQHRCITLLDAAQVLAHQAIDVQQLGCDFLVASAHKCYGPFGIGFIYGRSHWLEQMPPWQLGGEMVVKVSGETATFAPPPQRFEAGTLPLADIAGFGAALGFLNSFDRTAMAQHEQHLVQRLHKGLAAIDGLSLLSNPNDSIGITTFALHENADTSVNDLAHFLDKHHVAVRVGAHCAQPLYERLKVPRGLRVSVAGYNSISECERLIELIQQWFDQFYNPPHQSSSIHSPLPLEPMPLESTPLELDLAAIQSLLSPATSGQSTSGQNTSGQSTSHQSTYKKLMQAGALVPHQPQIRQAAYLIQGCESKTWLQHEIIQTQHLFRLDSDSRLVRGLGALMLTWFHAQKTETILNFDWQAACHAKGLDQYLSATKQQGFQALIQRAQALVLD